MLSEDQQGIFTELRLLLSRSDIEQPTLIDSLGALSHLSESARSDTPAEQDEMFFRVLTDSSLLGRSLAAGLLSLRMGLAAGLKRQECLDLALAGILSRNDITRLADERLNRPMGKSLRAEVLYLLQCRDERLDGSGPLGLSGKELDPPIRILSAACAYVDRLAAGWSGLRALVFIHGEGSLFDEGSARLLVQVLSIFPIGSHVALDSGEKGLVVGARPENPSRPIVCVRLRADGSVLEPPSLYDQEDAPQIASLLAEPWAGVPGPAETGPAWLQRLHGRLSSWPQEARPPLPEGLAGDWGRPSSELGRRQEESERKQRQQLAAAQADIDQSKTALAALLAAINLQSRKLSRMEEDQKKARSQSQEALRRRIEKRLARYQSGTERIKKRVEAVTSEVERQQQEQRRQLTDIQADIDRSKAALAALLEAEPRREEEGRAALLSLRRKTADELRRLRADPELKNNRLRLAAEQERLENQLKAAANAAAVLQKEKMMERQACRKAINLQRQKLRRMKEEQERALAESRKALRLRLEEKRARYQRQVKKIEQIEAVAAEVERQQREQRSQLTAIQADIDRSKAALAALVEVDERRQENEEREALLSLRQKTAGELRRLRADPKIKEIRLRLAAEQKRLADQREAVKDAASALLQEKVSELRTYWEKINLQRRKLSWTKGDKEKTHAASQEALRLRLEEERVRHRDRIGEIERRIEAVAAEAELAQSALEAGRKISSGDKAGQDPRLTAIQADIDRFRTTLAELLEAERRQGDEGRAALLNLRRKTAEELRRLRADPGLDDAKLRLAAEQKRLDEGHRTIAARQERWISEKKALEAAVIEKRRELEDLRRKILETSQRGEQAAAAAQRTSAEFEQKAAALLARTRIRLAARRDALQDDRSSLKAETEQAASQRAEALEAFAGRRDALEKDIRRLRGEWGDLQGLLGANEAGESAMRQALKTALSELDLRLLEAQFALDTARKETSALSQEQERRLMDWERAGRELESLAQQYEKLSGQTEPLLEQWRELSGQGLAGVSAVFREQILSRASELGLWSGRLSEVDRRLSASRAALESHIFLRCREAGLRAFREGRLDEARANLRRALSLKPDSEAQSLLSLLEGPPERAPGKEESDS
jgi:hypothetical protein